jgi:hypothetical protein
MPDSGIVDEAMFTAYETEPPEGRPRRARHVYVLCVQVVRETEDCDW